MRDAYDGSGYGTPTYGGSASGSPQAVTPTASPAGQPGQPGTPTNNNGQVYTTPIPGTTGYLQAQLLAKRAYENALARLSYQRSGILRNAGYTAQFGKDGSMSKLAVDPKNPYGQYQQMLRGQAQQDEHSRWGLVDRGIEGGLANHARTDLRYQHGAQDQQFGTSLIDALTGIQAGQSEAANTYNSSLWQAEQQALMQALAQNNFNPVLGAPEAQTYQPQPLPFPITPQQQRVLQTAKLPPARYYTRKVEVPLRSGQTIHFTAGRGYYAA